AGPRTGMRTTSGRRAGRGLRRAVRAGSFATWLATRRAWAARRGDHLYGNGGPASATCDRRRNPGARVHGALGSAIRPGDAPGACRLPRVETPATARTLVVMRLRGLLSVLPFFVVPWAICLVDGLVYHS